jgi:feruloyl esterase
MFIAPGMAHCRDGPGPNEFDLVPVLEQCVEQGRAPDRIIAVHRTDGRGDRSRPLCVFPQRAHYKGQGDSDAAENFECK